MCRHCWQPIQFFLIALKVAYTYVSWTSNLHRILQIDDIFISCDTCKLVNLVFTTESVKTPLSFLNCHSFFYRYFGWHFTFGLSYGWKDFSNYAYSDIFTLNAQFDFIKLIRHWACKFMGYTWFWFLYDLILIIISSWLIVFISYHNVL